MMILFKQRKQTHMGDVFSKNSVVIPVFTIPSATFRHVIDFFMNLNSMSRMSLKPAK